MKGDSAMKTAVMQIIVVMLVAAVFVTSCADPFAQMQTDETGSGNGQAGGDLEIANLTVAVSGTKANLAWTLPEGTSYTMIRVNWQPGDGELIVGGDRTSLSVGGLEDGTDYTFTVTAVREDGTTTVASASTKEDAPSNEPSPEVPEVTDLTATAGETWVELNWTGDPNMAESGVEWFPDGEEGIRLLGGVTRYRVEGLEPEKSYTFFVYQIDGAGRRSEWAIVEAKTNVAPEGVTMLEADTSTDAISLRWVDPDAEDLDSIEVSWTPGNGTESVAAGEEYFELTGLTQGEEYDFALRSMDDAGLKSSAQRISAVVETELTPEVSDLRAMAAPQKITLQWTEPNHPAFDHVEITWFPGDGMVNIPKGVTEYTVSSLDPETTYTFWLKAVNEVGDKTEGQSLSATPNEAPAPPSNLSVTPIETGLRVQWQDPLDADLDRIGITWTPGTGFAEVPAGQRQYEITGLQPEQEYTIKLRAIDIGGAESPEVTTYGIPLAALPGEVSNVQVHPKDSSVRITWTDPADVELEDIKVEWFPDGGAGQTVPAGVEEVSISGLTNDTSYSFFLYARNEFGDRTDGVNVVGTPNGPPERVTGLIGTGVPSGAELSWTDPSDADLDHIEIFRSPGFTTTNVSPGVENALISGLEPGQEYTFKLTAVDTIGNKSSEATTYVMADAGLPDPPSNVGFSIPTDGSIRFTWTDPTSEYLDKILISWNGGDSSIEVDEGIGEKLLEGLDYTRSYTFKLFGLNMFGEKGEGSLHSVTPNGPPAAVTGLSRSNGYTDVSLSWTDPSAGDLSHIEVEYSGASSGSANVAAGAEATTIDSLVEEGDYTFDVYAVDDAGVRSLPQSITGRPDTPPPSPPSGVGVIGRASGKIRIGWNNPSARFDYAEISVSPGGQTETTAGDSIWISGLNNSTTYTFTVKAVNAYGDKSSGSSTSGRPNPPPPKPKFLSLGLSDFSSSIVIKASIWSHSDITHFEYEFLSDSSTGFLDGTTIRVGDWDGPNYVEYVEKGRSGTLAIEGLDDSGVWRIRRAADLGKYDYDGGVMTFKPGASWGDRAMEDDPDWHWTYRIRGCDPDGCGPWAEFVFDESLESRGGQISRDSASWYESEQ